jgi:hypothetical protein
MIDRPNRELALRLATDLIRRFGCTTLTVAWAAKVLEAELDRAFPPGKRSPAEVVAQP